MSGQIAITMGCIIAYFFDYDLGCFLYQDRQDERKQHRRICGRRT